MLQKNKYWKTLLGFRAEGLVGKQVAYTDDTTYAAFVANAVEGEMGIFNADTGAWYDGSLVGSPAAVVPAGSNDYIFIALKRDGNVEKTRKFQLSQYTAKRIAYSAAVAQISDVVTAGSVVAGKEYAVGIMETTPGNQPFPKWYYSYVAKTGDDLTAVATAIVALINDKTNVINKDTDSIVTAALVNTNQIRITASVGAFFRITLSADALDLAWKADYTRSGTAQPSIGNGTYAQVNALQFILDEYKGVTTQYPPDGTRPEEFGQGTDFTASGIQYDIYYLEGTKYEKSPTPAEKHQVPHQIVIAVPQNGTNPNVAIRGILGL